jgi:hypothetical protein
MKKNKQAPKDPQLDIPSVANQNKHINFLAEEEKAQKNILRVDLDNQEEEERQREWKEGVEAGKREKDKHLPSRHDTSDN